MHRFDILTQSSPKITFRILGVMMLQSLAHLVCVVPLLTLANLAHRFCGSFIRGQA
jgi:hypothetical protein